MCSFEPIVSEFLLTKKGIPGKTEISLSIAMAPKNKAWRKFLSGTKTISAALPGIFFARNTAAIRVVMFYK